MKLSKIWMVISIILIITLSIATDSSLIQIVAAITGVIYVFGTAIENRHGQLFGIINSALYGLIMFGNGVYGTAIYDIIYCIPMQMYTFFNWGKDVKGKDRTSISKYSTDERVLISLATMLVIGVYSIIANMVNVQYALVDGISIILGIIGLYMTSKKKIEQWYTFIISNIAMIAMWSIKCMENISNIPMLIMWLIYLINNAYGLYSWSKKLKELNREK